MPNLRQKALTNLQRGYLDFKLPPFIDGPANWLERTLYDRSAQSVPIVRPIFIVGCHRSGTTVLYETLAQHPELVYLTNASSFTPRTPILSNRLFSMIKTGENQGVERFAKDGLKITYDTPSEGIRIWELYAPDGGDYCLDEHYSNPEMEHYLKVTIQKHLKYLNGSRFINKNPDNSVRIRYLNKLFPDAYFVHILRDGRAVCNSLLKFRQAATEFFGAEHRHATGGVKVKAWAEIERYWRSDPLYSAGLIWKEVIETLERDRTYIAPERYLEVRYEDFVGDPMTYLRRISEFCQLSWNGPVESKFRSETTRLQLGERNEAWRKRLGPEELQRLLAVIGPKMREYGYEV